MTERSGNEMSDCLASFRLASEVALWAVQHRVKLWSDVGTSRRIADWPLALHLADEQRTDTWLWAWRGTPNHPESRLAHQRPPAAAETSVLLWSRQQHSLRRMGAPAKHEERRKGHRLQHVATGSSELSSCTHLCHHRGQDELLWHGLQEGNWKRQVSHNAISLGSEQLHFYVLLQNLKNSTKYNMDEFLHFAL